MKLKRQMTEAEIATRWPAALELRKDIEDGGGLLIIAAWTDVEIAGFTPAPTGRCSECKRKVVEVTWFETLNNVEMEFHGLACRSCGRVLEFAGTSIGPVDLTAWLGGGQ